MEHTLGLAMIVGERDAKVLDRCLKSVVGSLYDDIAIVPTTHEQSVEDVARTYTCNISYFQWCDDFSAARNYAYAQLSTDYIMWLDADDVVSAESYKKLFELKPTLTRDAHVWMPYVLERLPNGEASSVFQRERIIRNGGGKWTDRIHEYILVTDGSVRRSENIEIDHLPDHSDGLNRNVVFLRKLYKDGKASLRNTYYFGRDLICSQNIDDKKEGEIVLSKYVEDGQGWNEELALACMHLMFYHRDITFNIGQMEYYGHCGLQHDSRFSELYVLLGDAAHMKKDPRSAIRYYKLAMEKREKPISPLIMSFYEFLPADKLSLVFYELQEYDEAVKYNAIALKYDPASTRLLENKRWMIGRGKLI